ncbi:hypothetical protein CEE37_01515 [candidate division LCP-89 bacterium B3_LCP]|uniref:Glycosyltransferase 2-like domain-containing protein n=1 Tax=candidate division LCP-89 bacterium B3_LCP TaxID=2012998 RepID=A0A532V5A8_UNCL8|nr:MAG: hypothetical protein CEE37_01515 [candidate division LCP-89 bacterium B3_LCP]
MDLKASVVIPVRNKLEFTRQCLESIAEAPPKLSYEIIVVDNASDDGTYEFLKEKQDRGELRLIHNDPPNPFAISCNQGAMAAKGEYIVFLNNDTKAYPDWLDEMVAAAEKYQNVGAVGAKLLYPDETIQHAGVAFHYFTSLKRYKPYHIFRDFPRGAPAVNKELEFQVVTGACLLTPKSIFHEMGGFDERFINEFEDVDYCLRLRDKGYKVIYTPKAELIHYEGQTPGRHDHLDKNGLLLQEKWGSRFRSDDLQYLEPEGFAIMEEGNGALSIYPGAELQQWWDEIQKFVKASLFREVIAEIEELAQIIPFDYEILELKGNCHLNLGEIKEARSAFANAQSMEPHSPGPKWGLAQVAAADGKMREAGMRVQRLIREFPQDERRDDWLSLVKAVDDSTVGRKGVDYSFKPNSLTPPGNEFPG